MPIVNLGNLQIHFVEQGDGNVLLVFPDNDLAATEHNDELDYFGDRYRAISFDLPGTGASTRTLAFHDEIQLYPWNYRADLACHLLRELEIATCWVLGSGLGALSALHFAGTQAALHKINVLVAAADSFLANLDRRTLIVGSTHASTTTSVASAGWRDSMGRTGALRWMQTPRLCGRSLTGAACAPHPGPPRH